MASYLSSRKKKKKKKPMSFGGATGARVGARTGRAPVRVRRPVTQPRGGDAVRAPQAPPTAASTIPAVETALSGGTGGYDLGADPAVAAAAGLAAKMRAMAQATALAKRKQAAIEYGDSTGVEGIDDATRKAAAENPYSVLKNLDHSFKKGTGELEEGLNASNLFYSGFRGEQLAEAARGYGQSRYDAGNAFRGLMSDVNSELASALMNADMMEWQSMMDSSGGDDYGEESAGDDGVAYSLAGGAKAALGIPSRTGGPSYGIPTGSRLNPAGNYSNSKKKPGNKKRNPYAYRPIRGGGSY